jgi:hypothetical protein
MARAAGLQSLLHKARHIHADQEGDGTKLTEKNPPLLGISDSYARRLLREIGSDPA